MTEVFERFTDRARRAIVLSEEEARLLGHDMIGTEHVLLGLLHEGEGVAAKVLDSLGVGLAAARAKIEEASPPTPDAPQPNRIPFTPRTKNVLELSLREALQLGCNYISTEHVLLGIVRDGECAAVGVLSSLGVETWRVRERVILTLSGYAAGSAIRPTEPLVAVALTEPEVARLLSWLGAWRILHGDLPAEVESATRKLRDAIDEPRVNVPRHPISAGDSG